MLHSTYQIVVSFKLNFKPRLFSCTIPEPQIHYVSHTWKNKYEKYRTSKMMDVALEMFKMS